MGRMDRFVADVKLHRQAMGDGRRQPAPSRGRAQSEAGSSQKPCQRSGWPGRLSPMKPILLLAATMLSALLHGGAPVRPAPRQIEIAPGIVLFMTASYGDVGLDGNAVAVI